MTITARAIISISFTFQAYLLQYILHFTYAIFNMNKTETKTCKLDCIRGRCKLAPIYLTSNNSFQRYDQKHVFCTYWLCELDLWPFDLRVHEYEYLCQVCILTSFVLELWCEQPHPHIHRYRQQRMPYLHCLTEAQVRS